MLDQGRCHVISREQAEAAGAAALCGALRVHGRAVRTRLMHGRGWRAQLALADTSSDEERPGGVRPPPPPYLCIHCIFYVAQTP